MTSCSQPLENSGIKSDIFYTDIDECATANGGCMQICSNNLGSFACTCGTGYTLNVDGLTCDGKKYNMNFLLSNQDNFVPDK